MLRSTCCTPLCPFTAKQPSFLRKQQRITSDRFTFRGGGGGDAAAVVSSSGLRDLVFVVNPQGVFALLLTG